MDNCEQRGFHVFADEGPQPWIGDATILIAKCIECDEVFTSDETEFNELEGLRPERFRFCRHRGG